MKDTRYTRHTRHTQNTASTANMRNAQNAQDTADAASGRTRPGARMRALSAAVAATAAAGLLLAGATAAVAAPAPAPSPVSVSAAAPYTVTPLTNADVHAGPSTTTAVTGRALAGTQHGAQCWTRGSTVVYHGYQSDIWVRLDDGFVNAVFLDGDQYGGLPASATC